MLHLHKNSGAARTALENIHFFKNKGYKVHVASMTLNKDLIGDDEVITHKLLPWLKSTGMWRRKWYNFQVQRLKSKIKPDITIGHGDIDEQDVLTLHNSVFLASELIHERPLSAKNEMYQIHGLLLKNQKFKVLIANSELMKNDCVNRFRISPDKIHVVYPALDTDTFFPMNEKKQELRKRFGFDERVVVALITSGNFKKRGLDIFSKAIDNLPAEIKDKAVFRAVGKDKPLEGLSSHIKFEDELFDIENYYRAIDIFVLPARIEEFGRVVLEAMGCGLPVICTDKVGASELLEGDSKNFIIPAKNVAALSEAMQELIWDSELRANLGNLNTYAAEKYSERNVYEKFENVLKALE